MNRLFWVIKTLLFLILLASCQSLADKDELARDYYNIGNAYSDLDDYEKAAEYFERAIALDASLNQAAYNLARVSLEISEYERAIDLLSALLEEDSENQMVLEMLGYAWYRSGDFEKANLYYKKNLDINPAHTRSLYNLTVLEKQNEGWSEARAYLDRLLLLDDKKEYRVLMAELALAEGDEDDAIQFYEDLILEYGGDKGLYQVLKDLYLKSERYYKALDMFALLVTEEKDSELLRSLYYDKSMIEFSVMDDVINGRQDLQNALEAGYDDEESLLLLLDEVDPVYRNEIERLIYSKISPEDGEEAEEPPKSNKDKVQSILDR